MDVGLHDTLTSSTLGMDVKGNLTPFEGRKYTTNNFNPHHYLHNCWKPKLKRFLVEKNQLLKGELEQSSSGKYMKYTCYPRQFCDFFILFKYAPLLAMFPPGFSSVVAYWALSSNHRVLLSHHHLWCNPSLPVPALY